MNDNVSDNIYIQLIKKAKSEKWCTKIFCTTCGCMDFRKEIKKLDPEALIKAMYEANPTEVYKLYNWLDYSMVIYHDINFLYLGKTRNELPEVVQEMLRVEDAWRKKKNERYIANQKAEQLREERAAVRRAENKAQHLKRHQIFSQKRESIIKEFMKKTLEEQILIVACDEEQLPDYYPFDLKTISTETLANLDKEQLETLKKRFSKLKKQEWKQFYRRVLNV